MPKPRTDTLTIRQRQVLRLTADLKSAKDIAALLNIAPSTVESHIKDAIKLLGVANKREAALLLRSQENTSPRELGSHSSRLGSGQSSGVDRSPEGELAPVARLFVDDHTTSPLGSGFHILRGDRANNDLTLSQRLLWIVIMALAMAAFMGLAVTTLDALLRLFSHR